MNQPISYYCDEDYRFSDGDAEAFAPCDHLKIVEPIFPPEEGQNKYTNCPVPIDRQIASLAQLDNGWYDEASRKYEPENLRWVTRLLSSIVSSFTLPIPYIYPTPDGLVRAEWSSGNAEVIVNINPANKSAEAIAALVGSDDVDELPVRFSDHNAERVLGLFLSRYLRS